MKNNTRHWVVLGGGGFVGTNLCRRLTRAGVQVVAFGRSSGFPDALRGCRWVSGDFFNTDDLAAVLENAEYVVHAISTVTPAKSNELPIKDVEENLIGSLRLIHLCIAKGVKRLIVLSSGGTVYGPDVAVPTQEDATNHPLCSYGVVKLAVEKYLAIYRHQGLLDSVVLRVANPYGPYQQPKGQGVIAATVQKILLSQPAEIWGDGTVTRDYIYIDDVVDAIMAAARLDDDSAPRLYNIGSGIGRTINEVIDSLCKIHGPIEVLRQPGRTLDVPVSVLSIHRAQQFLGWTPRTDWQEGLSATYGWFSEHWLNR